MIEIEMLRSYFANGSALTSLHSLKRCILRDISPDDLRDAVGNGVIIEQYEDDHPFPSCLIAGRAPNGRVPHIVMSDEGSMGRIITAYWPDDVKWEGELFHIRKEK